MSAHFSQPVLRRGEAEQMIKDLREAGDKIVSISDGATDLDKALAMEALVILQTKRNILEDAISEADKASEVKS